MGEKPEGKHVLLKVSLRLTDAKTSFIFERQGPLGVMNSVHGPDGLGTVLIHGIGWKLDGGVKSRQPSLLL